MRNRIRRRLSETIRTLINHIKPGFDIVLGAKAEIIDKNYKEIEKEIKQLFKQAGLI